MITSELALTKAFIDLFIAEDVYETPDLSREFAALTVDLDNEEAEAIPQALRNASSALAGELGRWRAIGDIAVRFDMHELVDILLDGFMRQTDPHQLANIATLAANPAVSARSRRRLEEIRANMRIQESVNRLIQIRTGTALPDTDLEQALDVQSWPGRHSTKELVRASPLVYVSEKDAPAAALWRVCAALVDSGARVRRIPSDLKSLETPAWASTDYPAVVWGGNGIAQWRKITGSDSVKTVQAPNELRQPVVLTRLIGRIADLLPTGVRLQSRDSSQAIVREAFSPEILGEGAFDSLEMAYLGGSSRSTLSRLTKETRALQPAGDRQHHWAFDQLITLRVIQAFKSRNARFRASDTLTGKLREIAAANVSSEIAIDAMGKMFRSTDDGFETLEGDQGAFGTIITVDEAFRPFKIGGGNVVPDLLRPSSMTAVDPIVLAGTPTIRSRRVPVRSLAETMTRGMATVRSAYPELNAAEIVDGVKVANAILAIGA